MLFLPVKDLWPSTGQAPQKLDKRIHQMVSLSVDNDNLLSCAWRFHGTHHDTFERSASLNPGTCEAGSRSASDACKHWGAWRELDLHKLFRQLSQLLLSSAMRASVSCECAVNFAVICMRGVGDMSELTRSISVRGQMASERLSWRVAGARSQALYYEIIC
jgi:hypothetical protein